MNDIVKGNAMPEFISTLNAETFEEKIDLFNAISNADSLEDMIGQTIMLENIVVQNVETADRETGELRTRARIVLVTPTHEAYACMSHGVETSLTNIFAVFGEPPYNPPLPVTPEKKQGSNGFRFTCLTIGTPKTEKAK